MKISLRSAFAVIVFLSSGQLAVAQTAEEIIDKSIAAMGGRAAFEKVKTRSMTGTITLMTPAGDIPGSIEVLNARPNKARTLIKADLSAFGAGPLVIDQRFDGQNGYVLDSLQGNRDITGNQLDNLRNSGFPHAFLDYQQLGYSVKLQGKEKIGSGEAYVLVFEPAKGSTIRQFVDAETMLPVRFVLTVNVPQVGADVEQTTTLEDYRDVDGLKMPFKLSSSSSLQSFSVTLDNIAHNIEVDEKIFAKP
jgi:outer membrane lipoprotein-sorting protein